MWPGGVAPRASVYKLNIVVCVCVFVRLSVCICEGIRELRWVKIRF